MNDTIVFYGLLDDEALPIDAVALELSALDHEGASVKPYLELINKMAARVLALSQVVWTTSWARSVSRPWARTTCQSTGDSARIRSSRPWGSPAR